MIKIIGKDLIGRESEPVRVRIEADAVRRFAETVGIPFGNRVPPTFFATFMKGSIEGVDLFQPGTIHGEQKFTYFQPVSIGDNIVYTRRIKDVFERSGKVGKMTYVIFETTAFNHVGEQVFSMSSTVSFSDHGDEI